MAKRSSSRSGVGRKNAYKPSVVEVKEATKTARTCIICGDTQGQTFEDLEEHVRTFHRAAQRIYPCQYCKKPFYSPSTRNRHQVHCVGKPLPPAPFAGSGSTP